MRDNAEGRGELKRYGWIERLKGCYVLIVAAFTYLAQPREVEINLLKALQLRKMARIELHGEPK